MKTTLLSIVGLAAFSSPLIARIGETFERCVERYGEGVKQKDGAYRFNRSGFILGINFHDGKADKISYFKRNSSGNGTEHISQEGIEQLMAINAQEGVKWRLVEESFRGMAWETEDGRIKALYDRVWKLLFIMTLEYEHRRNQMEAADERQRLDGL